jgi:hypothetical protein
MKAYFAQVNRQSKQAIFTQMFHILCFESPTSHNHFSLPVKSLAKVQTSIERGSMCMSALHSATGPQICIEKQQYLSSS